MATGPLDVPVLTDGVITLRAFADTDAAALATIWRDPAIRAHNTVPEPSAEAASAWIARSAATAAAGEAWEWAIVDTRTAELAGRRALKNIDWANRRAHAGSWVAPSFRGRRFAPRSLRLAAAHAFAHGVVRIQGACETDNGASLRSMLAAGMSHEGVLRAYLTSNAGDLVDAHMFSLLIEDLSPTAPRVPAVDGVVVPR